MPSPQQDHLTLDSLLDDPLTQLVMKSDRQTPADVRKAFAAARMGLAQQSVIPMRRLTMAESSRNWFTLA